MDEQRDNPKRKPLLTVEFQNEIDIATGKRQERMFIKMYFEARDSGLLAAIGDRRWRTLCCLATYMDQNGYCYPSQARMARDLGIHRQRVNERIKDLLAFRFDGAPVLTLHHTEQPRQSGKWGHNVYEIHQIAGLTIFDKNARQSRGATVSGKPDTVHSAQTVSENQDTADGAVSASAVSAHPDTNKNHQVNKTHTRVFRSNTDASALIHHFHQLCARGDVEPSMRELTQASKLIDDHGMEAAYFIMEYAVDAARDRFGRPPELFGGMLRFVNEALAAKARHLESQRKEREERKKLEEEATCLEAERQARQQLSPKERFDLRVSHFPSILYTAHHFDEIRRQIADEESYELPT